MYLLTTLMSSLEKCLFSSYAHFLNWIVCFFVIELTEFSIFWISINYRYMVCKILPLCKFFHFVNCFFCCAEAYEFDVILFVDFFFLLLFLLLLLCPQNYCQDQYWWASSWHFLLGVLWDQVLCLSLWSISS